MARPGAELSRDVVACPGADTCNIAVTQSRGLAKAIGERLEEEGWPRSVACASTSPAAPTAAASTTPPTSASSAPSAARTAAPHPVTRCCSAATSARSRSTSATRRCACRRRRARGRRPGHPPVRRRAHRRRGVPRLDGAIRRGHGDRRRLAATSTCSLDPSRAPRVLRRLRRDRPVLGRGRRVGVRDLSARYDAAVAAIDQANAADPNHVVGARAPGSPGVGPRHVGRRMGRAAGRRARRGVAAGGTRPPPAPLGGAPRQLPARAARLPAMAPRPEGTTRRRRRRDPGAVRLLGHRDRAGAEVDQAGVHRGCSGGGGCRLPGVHRDTVACVRSCRRITI